MQDSVLIEKTSRLKTSLQNWAKGAGLWDGDAFTTYLDHFDCIPDTPYVLLLISESYLYEFLSEYSDGEKLVEFEGMLEELGFAYERLDNVTWGFYPNDEDDALRYKELLEWNFLCSLVKPDFLDVYKEIYEFLSLYPDRLAQVDPRDFEYFLDGVFRNNGITSVVGPGSGDGGVDLRLYENNVLGDITTLVQAKRYSKTNPVGLEAVQALSAAVEDERTNRGMLVTTSRFLPGASAFAARQNSRLLLKTSDDIVNWMCTASERMAARRSEACELNNIRRIVENSDATCVGRVFHSTWGYNMTINSFAICVLESPGAGVLLPLNNSTVQGNNFQGAEIPNLRDDGLVLLKPDQAFTAKKSLGEKMYFSAGGKYYYPWNQKPARFDYMD